MERTDRFNDVSRIAVPAAELWKNLILQRIWDANEAIEAFDKLEYQQSMVDLYVVSARINSLALMIDPSLKRVMREEHYSEFQIMLSTIQSIQEAKDVFKILLGVIDELRITRVETKESYDTLDPTVEDMVKGT